MAIPFKMKNSALKMSAKSRSPMQANYGSPLHNDDINTLLEKRTKYKAREENLKNRKSEGKITFLGNVRRKIVNKKIEKNQQRINENSTAQKWRKDSKKTGLQDGLTDTIRRP